MFPARALLYPYELDFHACLCVRVDYFWNATAVSSTSVTELAHRPSTPDAIERLGAAALQAKVKIVADAIWTKLSGVFSKEVLHAQHVSVFCHILQVTDHKVLWHLSFAHVCAVLSWHASRREPDFLYVMPRRRCLEHMLYQVHTR